MSYAAQAEGPFVAALRSPRHPLIYSLPELRACFVEQPPTRLADRFVESVDDDTVYRTIFEEIRNEELGHLLRESGSSNIVQVPNDTWSEHYAPASPDDTLLLGLRAELKYNSFGETPTHFEHRYIAWSKALQRVAAQGGATINCRRDDGKATPIPERWIHRMEVDFGEAWASIKILEFRRDQGMGSHLVT